MLQATKQRAALPAPAIIVAEAKATPAPQAASPAKPAQPTGALITQNPGQTSPLEALADKDGDNVGAPLPPNEVPSLSLSLSLIQTKNPAVAHDDEFDEDPGRELT